MGQGRARIVNAARLLRYAAKLDHAEERLSNFAAWSSEARSDLRSRLAAYKAFQEASEALADVAAMSVKDLGRAPGDDYANLDILAKEGVLTEGAAGALREANGLRNRLVHEYNGLTDELALDSGERLVEALKRAVEEVRAWVSNQS